jgi:hypothetical protein
MRRLAMVGCSLLGVVLCTASGTGRGAADGALALEGVTAGRGVVCPLFRLDDGEMISLTGWHPEAEGRYRLTGRWQVNSNCMQGRSFRVEAAEALNRE